MNFLSKTWLALRAQRLSRRSYLEYACMSVLCLNMSYASAQIDNVPTQTTYANVASFGFTSAMDTPFIELRNAYRDRDFTKIDQLSMALQNYDMPAYVEYYRLSARTIDSNGNVQIGVPIDEIRQFLQRYDGLYIADKMRGEFLLTLGQARDWANFDLEYSKWFAKDDPNVEAYAVLRRLQAGQNIQSQLITVFTDPKKYNQGVMDLIAAAYQARQMSVSDVKLQVLHAIERRNNGVARRILSQIPDAGGSFFAIAEAAQKSTTDAIAQLEAQKNTLPTADVAMLWGAIAHQTAQKLDDNAKIYFDLMQSTAGNTNSALLTPQAYEWQVRSALKQQNWPWVQRAIESMPTFIRGRDNVMGYENNIWDYWYGESLMRQNQTNAARIAFTKAGTWFNFYGKLAQEALGQTITLPQATTISNTRLIELSRQKGLQQAKRLYDMSLRDEARREWNWEIKRFNDDTSLLAAAELARQMDMVDRSIYTADRTKNNHQFMLRYPTPFMDILQSSAQHAGVDIAFIYGLTRQESRFIKTAKSGVGASGLMQVMPATARWVAKKIGLNGNDAGALNDPATNSLLGAHYIGMLLQDLDGNMAMAAAAYNAGPGRARKWRSMYSSPIDAAIFAENIPFTETRDYVKNVLSNTAYYAMLMRGQNVSLRSMLGNIQPSQQTGSALP